MLVRPPHREVDPDEDLANRMRERAQHGLLRVDVATIHYPSSAAALCDGDAPEAAIEEPADADANPARVRAKARQRSRLRDERESGHGSNPGCSS